MISVTRIKLKYISACSPITFLFYSHATDRNGKEVIRDEFNSFCPVLCNLVEGSLNLNMKSFGSHSSKNNFTKMSQSGHGVVTSRINFLTHQGLAPLILIKIEISSTLPLPFTNYKTQQTPVAEQKYY